MAKLIYLTHGMVAIVSDRDYQWLNQWRWFSSRKTTTSNCYAARNSYAPGTLKRTWVLMHRLIMDAPKGVAVDHINGNSLDNRRENLRFATNSQNLANRGPQVNNTSGFKGVEQVKPYDLWKATIRVMGKRHYLGCFKTKEEAHAAYMRAAIEHFGEFANAG